MICYLAVAVVGLALPSVRASPAADLSELDEELAPAGDPRLFFVNFTQSLVQVNSTILAWALVALAILGAGAVALYWLWLESQNQSSGYGQSSSYGQQSYGYNGR
jgi:hypothetical protein